MRNKLTVEDIILESKKYLIITQISKDNCLKNDISSSDLYNFSSFLLNKDTEHLCDKCVILISESDYLYLNALDTTQIISLFSDFLNRYNVPCFLLCGDINFSIDIINFFNSSNIALLKTPLSVTEAAYKLSALLNNSFSSNTTIHGVLTEVYGMGILIIGKSGIGKSETALELVERGHRLIADDIVEISLAGNSLIGKGSEHIKYHMEIRGLGIVNIKTLFGIGSVKDSTKIDAIIEFEDWDSNKEYDRLGLDDKVLNILGVDIPKYLVPVRIGRNLAIIIEVAAKNQRLKKMGTFTAQEFNKRLLGWIQRNEDMLM